MTEDASTDQLFTLAERVLMLAGIVLLVVALVLASPLGFLTNFGGDDGDEAAAAGTPTAAPDGGTPAPEPAETEGPADGATEGSGDGTATLAGPEMGTATETEEETPTETEEETPTETEEPTPTPTETEEEDDSPGLGPGNPPGQDD